MKKNRSRTAAKIEALPVPEPRPGRHIRADWLNGDIAVEPAIANGIDHLIEAMHEEWNDVSQDAGGPEPRDLANVQLRGVIICELLAVLIEEWKARGVESF